MKDFDRDLIKLILRSPDIGDGWRQAEKMIFSYIVKHANLDMLELDHDNLRVRLRDGDAIVSKYL